jgi:hypothetical protein
MELTGGWAKTKRKRESLDSWAGVTVPPRPLRSVGPPFERQDKMSHLHEYETLGLQRGLQQMCGFQNMVAPTINARISKCR